ncbi:6-phosphogluconolactonase [Trifolium repens]|nr:6-phosphogluconolactonase [Trifolium repens]
MRIRKRQAIFSSSESISSLHLSDPHQFNRSPVMVQLGEEQPTHVSAGSNLDRYQPSDQTLPLIGKLNNGHDYLSDIEESGVHKHHNKQEQEQDPLDDDKVREQGKESGDFGDNKSNHISKGDILVVPQVLPSSSSTFAQDGRWCEGEKAIPLKKRKGRLENVGMETNDGTSKKMKTKMKTKMNKNCSMGKDDEDEESETKVNIKKRATKRGSALMEGSRCSRVNGRGWRCCQQTLVGYSLCEHHLGKGRLRSMSSVRSRSNIGFSTNVAPNNVVDHSVSNCDLEKKIMFGNDVVDDDHLDNDDEKKPVVMIAKKRMKLGMVKARSMSSLLGQTDNKVASVDENNNK